MSAIETAPTTVPLSVALAEIAGWARELDGAPRFPTESFAALRGTGVLGKGLDRSGTSLSEEVALVRAVAAADASTARVLDGHLNGVERLAIAASSAVAESDLEAIGRGELLIGVWGADPGAGEGPPARLARGRDGSLVLRGGKTFCSGAGGVGRALVVVREEASESRRLAYVDATEGLEIDRDWYRASGLRASESHRVEFHDAPVLALLGGENELMREPWISRDGVRTAATWAGIADGIWSAASAELTRRPLDESQVSAVGAMRVARGTIDRWLEHAAKRLEDLDTADPAGLTIECRAAITDAARTIASEAARACGSRALIAGDALDRGRRDLDLFLLQHRLDPQLRRLGRATLAEMSAPS